MALVAACSAVRGASGGISSAICIKRTKNMGDFALDMNHFGAMQNSKFNQARHALRKQGGTERRLAEILLDLCRADLRGWTQDKPNKRGATLRTIRTTLESGPKTTAQIGKAMLVPEPSTGPRSATVIAPKNWSV